MVGNGLRYRHYLREIGRAIILRGGTYRDKDHIHIIQHRWQVRREVKPVRLVIPHHQVF